MRGFLDGLLHPLTVPAHALALLALGLLIGQQRAGRLLLAAVAAFAAGISVGLTAIVLAIQQSAAADGLIAATAVAAILVAVAKPLPVFVCAALALMSGLALGLDSPPQAISIRVATATLVGTGLAACLALAVFAACMSRLRRAWLRIGIRIVGSWIAASAILVLALRFRA
jgi:hydrogenase/urease accessory protein HupE